MKKIIFLILIIFIISITSFVCINVKHDPSSKCLVYTDETLFFLQGCEKVNQNNYSIFKTDPQNLNYVLSNIGHCYSIEYTYSQLNIDNICKIYNARIIDVNIIDNLTIYNLYSKKIQSFIDNYHKKFNMQVSISKGESKIGIPLLIGSV